MITIADMVRAQAMLLDALGVERLFAVVGGSMGAMQVLQWAADYPERLFAAVCIPGAARHTAQNIAFHEVGRQAIMADPDWRGGDYAALGTRPENGRAVVRALNAAGARVSFLEIDTDKGHDAFLLDEPVLRAALGGFLDSAARSRGLG